MQNYDPDTCEIQSNALDDRLESIHATEEVVVVQQIGNGRSGHI